MRKKKRAILTAFMILGILMVLNSCAKKSPDQFKAELMPLEDNPLVAFRILLDIGSAHDPAGKEGLCQLTWSMLAQGGSQDLAFKEITKKFYPMATSVRLRVDKEMSVFTAQVHKDNLDKFYTIFKSMLLDPGFREEDFIRLKTNQLDHLDKTLVGNQDEQFGKEILNLMMYKRHPYGHNEAGTIESLKTISLEDVKGFYQTHFLQGNVTVGLIGGYSNSFVNGVLDDFSALPDGRTPPLTLPEQRMPDGLEFVIADKQTPATAISMGFPLSISRADDEFFALWIAGSHFGEHRQHLSHLFQKIREERGQNYGDYAYIEHFFQGRGKFPATNYCRQQQYFSIWIRPLANSNRHFVIRQALRELKKLVEEGISEERFELTRTYLLNYTKLYAQTLGERLGWKMDSQYYGYKDFLDEVQKRLPKISLEDVNKAIKKHLNPDNLYIAVITQDAEGLKNALIANTPSPITYANPSMPEEILNEDLVIQAFPLNATSEKVQVAPASEFFKKQGPPPYKE
jgi:zinc protease